MPSHIKTRVILKNALLEKFINYFLGLVFLLYVAPRANIVHLRFQHNLLSDDDIGLAHSYVYILWIIADALASSGKIILSSSLPLFAVILFNTMVLSVLNFVLRSPNLDPQAVLALKNLSKFTSLVKWAHPTLMLLDVFDKVFAVRHGRGRARNERSWGKQVAAASWVCFENNRCNRREYGWFACVR
ncbi:hypothetical protein DFJ73DRAFT_940164 [Zopfochytrium polystomum]|nr:hypothetical protein DFJ73DRAFT_940164 [Zopfochytrium polystomum]